MNVHVRLTRQLYEQMRRDLERPHPFAGERVGFVTAKLGNVGSDPLLVFLGEYRPVPDHLYLDDPWSGARLSGDGIRAEMQRLLTSTGGLFHVHMHPHYGHPALGPMDERELPRLVQSFRAVSPRAVHGLLLLSWDLCGAHVWVPGSPVPAEASRVSVIGYPLELMEAT